MAHKRVCNSSSWDPLRQAKEESSQFAARPFTDEVQQVSHRPPTLEEVENGVFKQNKFEAFGLQIARKGPEPVA